MKKPYIKKITEVSKFKVWIVDGKFIREEIDEEFTNYGQHYRFKFIPKHEFWIDREESLGEQNFFIDHLLVENRLMQKGYSYNKACSKADRIEKGERAKSKLMQNEIKIKKDKKKLIDSIHKKLLKKYSKGKIKVWIINGELVRDLFDIEFTEGGHDKIYKFVPKNEIWIDDDVEPNEIKYILIHELHERNLMAKGWCYDTNTPNDLKTGKIKKGAHPDSSRIEYYCRHHPKETEKKIKIELKKIRD